MRYDPNHKILNDVCNVLSAQKTHDRENKNDLIDLPAVADHNEMESPQIELDEYKNDFLEMNIGSLRAIMHHAKDILDSLDNPSVKENLTESWLQGKIAITEDYMRTIHDFVKYVPSDDDNVFTGGKQGLWDNIRNKKQKEGKKYKPAKRGDKDRPDPEQWKKLTE